MSPDGRDAQGPTGPPPEPDRWFFYPWEKRFQRLVSPFEEFIERETTSGLVLIAGTIVALLLANSVFRDAYETFMHTRMGITVGAWSLHMDLLHWINEGLMVFFFFVVGLEIKREIVVGELSDIRGAALPVLAAAGGMIFPALLYHVINPGGVNAAGWGIPMATDIAFAISALVIMGKRIPQGIMVFLVALAIADDLGAVLVIALFYTRQFDYWALAWATGFLVLLLTFNLSGVRRNTPYLVAGVGLWLALLSSGIHATIAGVLAALCIPARSRYLPDAFGERLSELSRNFVQSTRSEQCLLRNVEQNAVLRTVDYELNLAQPPLQRMLDAFHLPVALLVIPLFALANAGIALDAGAISDAWRHPVARGIVAGLVLGKATGITLFSWFALRLGLARLPEGLSLRHVFGAGLLGGIGFTMSIFIAELCFGEVPHLLNVAKTAVIFGSLASAVLGMSWLLLVSRRG